MNKLVNEKIKNPVVIVCVLVGFVIASYLSFLHFTQIENYRLFNIKSTVSWAQTQNTIYRMAARGNIENLLTSQDRYGDFKLSLKIVNPLDCGLLFDFLDGNNYRFIYFQNKTHSIVAGRLVQGKAQVIRSVSYNYEVFPAVLLKKEGGTIGLTVNNRPMLEIKSDVAFGKVGLMLNSINSPPTVFDHIGLVGKLENGTQITTQVQAAAGASTSKLLLSFLPFYLLFIVLVFYCSRLEMIKYWPRLMMNQGWPIGVHIALAVAFFWPFITQGHVAIFSYDNLGEIYPLFVYAKHNFINILNGQAPWLWNPYIHNGFPFYSNHWDMIYYPLNWPVFLVSDRYLLTALTLKSFLEVVGIGILAYGFFIREFNNSRWALFSSIAYQLGSILIFTMSVFPATSLYFAMTFYLYVLWSMPARRALLNFLLLSFAVVLVLTSANVAFVFYACLTLSVVSIYRFVSLGRSNKSGRVFGVTALAWIVGTMISAVRIVSCLEGVTGSNRMAENFHTIHDRAYMLIRLFVPEIAGWLGPNSFPVLMSPNLKLIFAQLDLPSNPQNNFFIYFGVIPALFLLLGFVSKMSGRAAFWKIYSLVVVGIALLWQPLWGILSILCFPLNHYSYHAVIIPVGVCGLMGYAGMAWETGEIKWEDVRRGFFMAIGFVSAYVLVFETYLFPTLTPITRVIFVVVGLSVAIYFYLRNCSSSLGTIFIAGVGAILRAVTLTLLMFATVLLAVKPFAKKELVVDGLILPFLWILTAVVVVLQWRMASKEKSKFRLIVVLDMGSFFVAACALCFGLLSSFSTWVFSQPESLWVYGLDIVLGVTRWLLLTQLVILIFVGYAKKNISARLAFSLILIFSAGDLIVFNARFNDITAPFYFKQAFYPKAFFYRDLYPEFKKQHDLINYRVSHQDLQDFNANKNLVFEIPSYTGTVGYMTKRFSKLLTSFGYPEGIYMLYPEDASQDQRFLDLSAVRYVMQEGGSVIDRPTALGRLNFFYNQETILDDEQTLLRLKDASFDPHKAVLLSSPLGAISLRSEKSATFVPILEANPDKLTAIFQNDTPGYLLFAESFDEGWTAFIDGQAVPVLRANYNFMACPVANMGRHEVRFVYNPPKYRRNLNLTMVGLGLFIFAVLALLIVPRAKNRS